MARRMPADDEGISHYINALQRLYEETGIYVSQPLGGALYDFELLDKSRQWHASLTFNVVNNRYQGYVTTDKGVKEIN